jgi:hypothetical protein
MYSGTVYPIGDSFLSLFASGAKRKKQMILGTVNQKIPGSPRVNACCEQTKMAGAHTQLTAMLQAACHTGTVRSATKKPSSERSVRVFRATISSMLTAKIAAIPNPSAIVKSFIVFAAYKTTLG